MNEINLALQEPQNVPGCPIYDINLAWKSTCKILLGDEIGDMGEYVGYLSQYNEPVRKANSCFSGTEIIASPEIPPYARVFGHSELENYQKRINTSSFSINKIKDLDSLLEEITERVYYTGNIVLGESGNVVLSNRCSNCWHVYNSQEVYDSKYVAYTTKARYGEYSFGSNCIGETQFAIRCFETYKDTRCMESVRIYTSSDCYYTGNIDGCTNCMFSFNLRNKHYRIGNLELQKDKYLVLKAKLIMEMRETLGRKKTIPGVIELLGGKNE